MILPAEVEAITAQYLALTDNVLPGQILGLYLTGSVPLGDFHPGRSDIDGVVVVAEPMTEAAVRPVHEKLPERPYFDVTYLTADELAVAPDRSKPVVYTLDGEFKEPPYGGPVGPVLWSELARQSLAVRSVPGLTVHDDQQALVDFTRANLTAYWAPSSTSSRQPSPTSPTMLRSTSGSSLGTFSGSRGSTRYLLPATSSPKPGPVNTPSQVPGGPGLCTRATHRAGHAVVFTVADASSGPVRPDSDRRGPRHQLVRRARLVVERALAA